jgi:hypothetical protein
MFVFPVLWFPVLWVRTRLYSSPEHVRSLHRIWQDMTFRLASCDLVRHVPDSGLGTALRGRGGTCTIWGSEQAGGARFPRGLPQPP